MDKVLIFTNFRSLFNVDNNLIQLIDGVKKLDEHPILRFDALKLTPVNTIEDGQIFFLKDSMTQSEYEEFVQPLSKDCPLYILYHSKESNFKLNFDPSRTISTIGMHIPNDSGLYSIVLDILTDNKGDEIKRIVTAVFKPAIDLEIRNFLNNCNNEIDVDLPFFIDKTFCGLTHEKTNNESVQSLFEKWRISKNRDDFIIFRDKLFEWKNTI